MKVIARSVAISALLLCATTTGHAADLDIDGLPRSASEFKYFELGRHVPARSGWKDYVGGRTVIHPDMGLPIELDRNNDEHMYCNSQVYGLNKQGNPSGDRKSNHIDNFRFPWISTFCERRDFPGIPDQFTAHCGGRKSHQGSDCRPPKPTADHYFIVAVEGGRVLAARHNLVEVQGDSGILWKYRHGGTPLADIRPTGTGTRVEKGRRLAKVTDLGSTSIHLHLESERPAGTDRDNMPSLILAYQRDVLGLSKDAADETKRTTPVLPTGELAADTRFEIATAQVSAPCASSSLLDPLETPHVAKFSSLWCHNDSIMGLVAEGEGIELVYYKPRPGIRDAAARNPVLFGGTASSGSVTGSARHYSERCGDRQFPVAGVETGQGALKRIDVSGSRPAFSGACDRPSFVNASLIFTFMQEFAAPDDTSMTESPAAPGEPVIEGACAAVAGVEPIRDSDQFISLWCHNGSILGLTADGEKRQLVYYKPKETLREAAERQPVLFSGTIRDGRYEGRAVNYQQACNDPAFDVAGSEASPGRRTILLSGMRKRLRNNCTVIDTVRQELSFEFIDRLTDEDPGDAPIADTSCTAAAGQPPLTFPATIELSSLWCLDGSILGMSRGDGEEVRIVYYKPRADLRSKVADKSTLFSGTVQQSAYTGTLTATDEVCNQGQSAAQGAVSLETGRPVLRLVTQRPDPGQGCSPPVMIEQKIEIGFIEAVSIKIDPAPPPDAPVAGCTSATSEAVKTLITEERIRRFSPRARADMVAALLCNPKFLDDADLSTDRRVVHFMTQVATETAGMEIIEENMNYSASRLREIFPTRVTPAQAQRLAHKPREIANHVYGGRLGNLGQHTDDGWTYRGSGYLQITGRGGYRDRGREVGLPLEENPDLARQANEGLVASTAYWTARRCNRQADTDDITKVRFCVNGGQNGIAHARLWLQKARRTFSSAIAEAAPETEISDDAVAAALIANGRLPASAEAEADPEQIKEALRALQREHGLNETGELDDDTFYALVNPQEWRNPLPPE